MNPPKRQPFSGDLTAELAQRLPGPAVALYEAGPHKEARLYTEGAPLTGRQVKVVRLRTHRETIARGELADGLAISRAAASELVARRADKHVVVCADDLHDPHDRRDVRVRLAERAAGFADGPLARWRDQREATFARFLSIDPDTSVALLRDLTLQLKGRPTA
jgi:hypothetical protein